MAKVLTKPCRCVVCEKQMNVGDEFRWDETTVTIYSGGSGRAFSKDVFRPRHAHDCFSDILDNEKREEAAKKLRLFRHALRATCSDMAEAVALYIKGRDEIKAAAQ